MATLQLMASELAGLFTLYRQPCPDKQGLEFRQLVMDWCDVLDGVSDVEFLQALREVKRSSRFFPVPADVYIAVESARKHGTPTSRLAALPEQTRTFDEQSTLNREWGAKILEMLRDQNRKHSRRPMRPDFQQAVGDLSEGMAQ